MAWILPHEQTKDWDAIECVTVARDLASIRSTPTRRSGQVTAKLDAAVTLLVEALALLKQDEREDEREARMERELERIEDASGHPVLSEWFGWGERYAVVRMRLGSRGEVPYIAHRGYVIGHDRIWVEDGGPESGPGEPYEADAVLLKCDDGQTRKVNAGDLEPDEDADMNIAMWGTP